MVSRDMRTRVIFLNRERERLVGILNRPRVEKHPRLCVVLVHGFTGNKDRDFFPDVARRLARAGYPVFRFDFSGNGESEGKFGDATLSKEVGDLRAALDALEDRGFRFFILVGHSMGGAVSLLLAPRDRRVRALIMIAGVGDTRAMLARYSIPVLRRRGPYRIIRLWGRQFSLRDEFFAELSTTDLAREARHVRIPTLLVHGDRDRVIPIEEALSLFQVVRGPKRFVIVRGASHSFTGPTKRRELAKTILDWFREI